MMKARWQLEPLRAPIESPARLSIEVGLHIDNDPKAWPLCDLLSNAQHLGGWKGGHLQYACLRLMSRYVGEPGLLRGLYDCDSRFFEGEHLGALWAIAMAKKNLSKDAIENLFHNYERPKRLGDAPFDWFVANHTEWPRELLLRSGVNPDCAGPPPPPFLARLLACEIPESDRKTFASKRQQAGEWSLRAVGLALINVLPPESLVASIAQEVMSENFSRDAMEAFEVSRPQPKQFSRAAWNHFRAGLLIELIVDLLTFSFQRAREPTQNLRHMLGAMNPFKRARAVDGLPRNAEQMGDFENCIFEWIPEIRKDERFLWALDRHFSRYGDAQLARLGETLQAFERVRGASIREKPIVARAKITGVPLWSGVDAVEGFADILLEE